MFPRQFPLVCLFILLLTQAAVASESKVLHIQYEGFEVWVDCERRAPILFHYFATEDDGNFPRDTGYRRDPSVPLECQSLSDDTFQSVLDDEMPDFDVGHQVPANHFDHSETAISSTNQWTNLLPQTASLNRGAWLRTEEIIECLRDEVDLEIWGGPIWGANLEDDYFVESHGVETPSAFWKVIIRSDTHEGIAWIFPNATAPESSLDNWLTSIEMVERISGLSFAATNKDAVLEKSWEPPQNCDFS